ncbi:hypothetical protein ANO11243_061370 [Dothideomycetidae sp. 11243]|nr:hypothetical protein ANO11243_061370 [fungal sp. No.11243]
MRETGTSKPRDQGGDVGAISWGTWFAQRDTANRQRQAKGQGQMTSSSSRSSKSSSSSSSNPSPVTQSPFPQFNRGGQSFTLGRVCSIRPEQRGSWSLEPTSRSTRSRRALARVLPVRPEFSTLSTFSGSSFSNSRPPTRTHRTRPHAPLPRSDRPPCPHCFLFSAILFESFLALVSRLVPEARSISRLLRRFQELEGSRVEGREVRGSLRVPPVRSALSRPIASLLCFISRPIPSPSAPIPRRTPCPDTQKPAKDRHASPGLHLSAPITAVPCHRRANVSLPQPADSRILEALFLPYSGRPSRFGAPASFLGVSVPRWPLLSVRLVTRQRPSACPAALPSFCFCRARRALRKTRPSLQRCLCVAQRKPPARLVQATTLPRPPSRCICICICSPHYSASASSSAVLHLRLHLHLHLHLRLRLLRLLISNLQTPATPHNSSPCVLSSAARTHSTGHCRLSWFFLSIALASPPFGISTRLAAVAPHCDRTGLRALLNSTLPRAAQHVSRTLQVH